MQDVLIVSATIVECQGLLKPDFEFESGKFLFLDAFADFKADLLITGVGVVATTFHLTRVLSGCNYKLLVNIGLAGTFHKSWKLGTVVNVQSDQFGDFGAENHDDFISVFDLGLLTESENPFTGRKLIPVYLDKYPVVNLMTASSITVNKVHGNQLSIEKVVEKYHVDIESMEGAAFFYTANMFQIPSLQIRAISNYVEPRNRDSWQIILALTNLSMEIKTLLCSFALDNFL